MSIRKTPCLEIKRPAVQAAIVRIAQVIPAERLLKFLRHPGLRVPGASASFFLTAARFRCLIYGVKKFQTKIPFGNAYQHKAPETRWHG